MNLTVGRIVFEEAAVQVDRFPAFRQLIQEKMEPLQFGFRKPTLTAEPAKLGVEQVLEGRAEQGFLKNGFETHPLVGRAVNGDLFVGRPGEQKSINNKFKIEIVLPLNKGANGKHVPGGKVFGPPAKILDNPRGAPETNRFETLHLQNPEIVTLVNAVTFLIGHHSMIGPPRGKLQSHRGSRKSEGLPEAVRQIPAI